MRTRTLADGTPVSALSLGVMTFGTLLDEKTSFAILDRFVEAGGTFIDTSNNYAFWLEGATGDESETMLGRWLASRGARDRVVIGTKVGARPTVPGAGLEAAEGLSAPVIERAMEASLRRLGTDHVDVYWAHIEDRTVPLDETLGAFAGLIDAGKTGLIGASNHATWRVERARAISDAQGWPRYTCIQERHSYLQPRPGARLPAAAHVHMTDELFDYARHQDDLTLIAYSPLIEGAYTRSDKPLSEAYEHPGTTRRRAVLAEVSSELGATPNQVVLAWLIDHDPPILPLIGVSSVRQLDEAIGALDIKIDDDQRRRLNEAV